MTTLKTWLGGLLALQLLIATAFLWAERPSDASDLQQPLLTFTPAEVDRIVIREGANKTTLVRSDGHWQLPELSNLPAKEENVKRLLEKLQALQTGWPVATTKSSHSRFELTENNHQRHISLYNGDDLAGEVLLGSSPGLRQVHLRRPGEDAVYTGELPAYEVPAQVDHWLDKNLLATDAVTAIEGADYRLEKQDDQWSFGEAGPSVDADKAQTLASALGSLSVIGPADKPPAAADAANKITLKVEAGEQQWTYQFMEADDSYYVSRNDRDTVFKLAKFNYERIANVDHAALAATDKEQKTGMETADASEYQP